MLGKKIISVKAVATEGMFMFSYVETLTPQGKGISMWRLWEVIRSSGKRPLMNDVS